MSADSISEEQWKQIKDALRAGNKIEAIKLYREFTSSPLVEAKDAIDKLEAEMRIAEPEKFPKRTGCFGMIVAGIAAVYCMW